MILGGPPIDREIGDCPLVIAVGADRSDAAVGTGRRVIRCSCLHQNPFAVIVDTLEDQGR